MQFNIIQQIQELAGRNDRDRMNPGDNSSEKGELGNPLNETERGQGHICLQFFSKQKKAHPLPTWPALQVRNIV